MIIEEQMLHIHATSNGFHWVCRRFNGANE